MSIIYLAGPMMYSDDQHEWRDEIIDEYSDTADFVDPTEHLDATYDDVTWRQPWQAAGDLPAEQEVVRPKDITDTDKRLIGKSDAMLINLTETTTIEVRGEERTVPVPSYGTNREHEYMACQLGRPVAVWYSEELDKVPVWAMSDTELLSPNLDDCIEFLAQHGNQQEVSDLLT